MAFPTAVQYAGFRRPTLEARRTEAYNGFLLNLRSFTYSVTATDPYGNRTAATTVTSLDLL